MTAFSSAAKPTKGKTKARRTWQRNFMKAYVLRDHNSQSCCDCGPSRGRCSSRPRPLRLHSSSSSCDYHHHDILHRPAAATGSLHAAVPTTGQCCLCVSAPAHTSCPPLTLRSCRWRPCDSSFKLATDSPDANALARPGSRLQGLNCKIKSSESFRRRIVASKTEGSVPPWIPRNLETQIY